MPRASSPSPLRVGVAVYGAVVAALMLGGRTLVAQPMASIFVGHGDRVRFTTRDGASRGARRVGVLQQVFRDSVTVDWPDGVRETLPLGRLARLEVSDGSGSFVVHGMGYGFVAGAVAGAAYGLAQGDGGEYFPPVAVAAVMSVAGGLVGTAAGGLVGALGRRERWTRVRLEQPLRRVTISPYTLPYTSPRGRGTVPTGLMVGVRF